MQLLFFKQGLVKSGTIYTLRKDTELCENEGEANRPHYIGAVIFRQTNGELDNIYVQPPSENNVLFLFQRYEES